MLISQTVDHAMQAFESKDYAKALTLFEQAEPQDPNNLQITLWLAKTHQALGHRAAAIEILQRLTATSTDKALQTEAKSILQTLMSTNGQPAETTVQTVSALPVLEGRTVQPIMAVSKPTNLVRRWSSLSLRVKGTIAAVAIGVLPVLTIGTIAYQVANQAIVQEISATEQNRAEVMASKVNAFLFERYGDIQVLAALPIFSNPRVKAIIPLAEREQILTRFAQTYGVYDSIAAFDLKGNLLAQSAGNPIGNHSDRAYFQQVLKTRSVVISEPEISKSSGKEVIHFAAPIRDSATNKIIGVVRSRMPVNKLANVIKAFGTGDQEYFLADAAGNFFLTAHPEDTGKTGETLLTGFNKLTATGKPASAILTNKVGNDRLLMGFSPLGNYQNMPELKWQAMVGTDANVAFAPQAALLLTLTVGSAVVALLVGAIAAYLANKATQPILEASEAVQKLGQGDLETRIAVAGEDELAVLGSNINQMAGEIQSLLSQTQQQAEQRKAEQEKLQQQVDTVAEGVTAIASGKLDTRIPRLEGGEGMVQDLAENINQMTGQIQALVTAQEQLAEDRKAQADSLTQQVLGLLAEVKGAAKGDLTVKAKVNEGEMGAVADSFNYLVSSLRRIVTNIKDTAGQVINTTGSSIVQTTDLAHQAQAQAIQVEQTLMQIEQVVSSIQEVAQAAQQAETVVQKATQTAQAGGEAVDRTVDGINQLRITIGEAAKMMKRLGEGSQQIGQIVILISQIASKTDLLALNATIEAARAGEQGLGFAVVADEVRKLAERSASATKEIAELVDGIQTETGRMISAMDAGTEEVVRGTQLAATAKLNLQEIM